MNTQIIIYTISIIGLILFIYACFVEPYLIHIADIEINIPDLPVELNGLSICHLSDMHIYKYGFLEKLISQKLKSINSDICVVTGDIFHSSNGINAFLQLIGNISTTYGIYAIPGNGEHISRIDLKDAYERLKPAGINLLVNTSDTICINDCKVNIIGVDDPFMGYNKINDAYMNCNNYDFSLLLAHSPDIIAELDDYRPNLILAGHTHGGQIRFPVIGSIWNNCRHVKGVSKGIYDSDRLSKNLQKQLNDVIMYVNRGLSSRVIRMRFLCKPEITLIKINNLKKS